MNHINALVNVNGIPYLLGEYLDHNCWQQLNEYDVTNEIVVDTTEAMRAIIDISLRDIPTNRDGSMYLNGNNSLSNILLNHISKYYNNFYGKLDTIKGALKIKVNYQLENAHTGQIIRSTIEEFRIPQRNYFVKINVDNTNDNPILTNFSNTIVSSISQFTHGRERMILRITNIQLCYECVKPNLFSTGNRVGDMMRFNNNPSVPPIPNDFGSMYNYHQQMQSSQLFPNDGLHREGPDITPFNPPRWAEVNPFYHFEDDFNSLILHENEINDKRTRIMELPCGVINVNRSFYINPGHQLVFKFSIWKNDTAVINDPSKIAEALHIKHTYLPNYIPSDYDNHHYEYHNFHHHDHDDKIKNMIFKILNERKQMDYKQNDTINKLNNMIVNNIYPILKKLDNDIDEDDNLEEIPNLPTNDENNHQEHSHHHNKHKHLNELYNTIKNILIEIESLKNKENDVTYEEIDDETIASIIANAVNSTRIDN